MSSSTISVFSKPDDFAAALRERGSAEFLVTDCSRFRARFTCLTLHNLRILSVEENLPRIAFISLPTGVIRISWPIGHDGHLVCNGIRVRSGEILTQTSDVRAHERLDGGTHWRDIQVPARVLVGYGQRSSGRDFKFQRERAAGGRRRAHSSVSRTCTLSRYAGHKIGRMPPSRGRPRAVWNRS
jgi:hypothetical protein